MGIQIDVMDVGKVRTQLREYIQQVIDKGGDAVAEINCDDVRDSYIVMLVLREMHLELLSKKITPVIKLEQSMKVADALEAAMVMKAFGIATEKLQKFHAEIDLKTLREQLTEEALDSLRGKTKSQVADELSKVFPEIQSLIAR